MTTDEHANDATTSPARGRRWLLGAGGAAAIIGLWLLLELWGLGGVPFHTKGEPREGLVVWEMTHGGGWVLPLRNGTEVPSKPPLFHWMGALASAAAGGTDEWSIRLPSAMLSLGGALATYAAGTALWGPAAGMIGATVVMTSFEWQRAATSARVDMTLTFGLSVAFLSYVFFSRGGRPRWLVPFYGGVAFAVLAKGPVGAVLPALVVVASCLLRRDLSPLGRMRLGRGMIAVAVIAGSWYMLALMRGGLDFLGKQVLNENVLRLADAEDFEGGHRHSAFYLLGGLLAGFLPWSLFLPAPALALWRSRRSLGASDVRAYLLVWVAVVFGLYALAVSKRSVYLLSLYPALGLLLAWWWADAVTSAEADAGWLRACLRPAAWLIFAALVTVLAVGLAEWGGLTPLASIGGRISTEAGTYAAWVGDAFRHRPLASLSSLAAAAASASWLALALRTPSWARIWGALVGTVAAATLLIQHAILPEIAGHKTYRAFMPAVRRVVGDSTPPSFFRTFDYGAVFYWRGHIGRYEGDLSVDAPRHLLMTEKEWEQVAPVAQRFERVPLPADGGDRRRLVLVRRRDA